MRHATKAMYVGTVVFRAFMEAPTSRRTLRASMDWIRFSNKLRDRDSEDAKCQSPQHIPRGKGNTSSDSSDDDEETATIFLGGRPWKPFERYNLVVLRAGGRANSGCFREYF